VERGKGRTRFEAFDGLRAIAACLVVVHHVGLFGAFASVPSLARISLGLNSGVAIFFVISGFLLYLPYARAIGSGTRLPGWRRFASHRAVRIVPAYWVAVTVVGLLPIGSGVFGANMWRYYSLTQTYKASTAIGGLSVAWSLCVVVAFYLTLPVLAWLLAHACTATRRRSAATVQLTAVGVLAAGSLLLHFELTHSLWQALTGPANVLATSLPALFDWFAIGIAFAIVASEWEAGRDRFRPLRWLWARPGGCWSLAGVCFCWSVLGERGGWFLPQVPFDTHVAAGLAAGLLVLPAIHDSPVTERALPIRLLRTRLAAWLGLISYGIYLWHEPILELAFGKPDRVLGPPVSLGGSLLRVGAGIAGGVALGAASWYLIERPCQRRLRMRWRPAPVSHAIAGRAAHGR
jgi:peptidoglycan/LPS O-acetylase OafA/YrhL